MRSSVVLPLLAIATMLVGCGSSEAEPEDSQTTTTSVAEFDTLNDNGDLAVGETRLAEEISTHCGLKVIYRSIAGSLWEVDGELDGEIPDEWKDAVTDDAVDLVVELVAEGQLEATAAGSDHTVTYVPAVDPPLCD
jgi:hypothetical protein